MRKIDDKRLVCGVFARWLFRFFCVRVHEPAPNRNNDFCFKRKNALKKELFAQCFKGIYSKMCKLFATVQTFCVLFLCCFAQLSFFYMQRCFFKLQALQIFKTVKKGRNFTFRPLLPMYSIYATSFVSSVKTHLKRVVCRVFSEHLHKNVQTFCNRTNFLCTFPLLLCPTVVFLHATLFFQITSVANF